MFGDKQRQKINEYRLEVKSLYRYNLVQYDKSYNLVECYSQTFTVSFVKSRINVSSGSSASSMSRGNDNSAKYAQFKFES